MTAQKRLHLAISGKHHQALRSHLFPGDGKEAVAFALCGRARRSDLDLLLVQDILPIPHEQCSVRTPTLVTWPGEALDPILARAMAKGLAVVKIHSHPTGDPWFSPTDDESDRVLFPSIYGWLDQPGPLASAIMLPDGRMVGRAVDEAGIGAPIDCIRVAGDDFLFWHREHGTTVPAHAMRVAQAFGEDTYARLRRLKIGVVGCSGTGSIVIEQLARNGVGHLVLIDPDTVEDKNLNRILNSTAQDARVAVNKTLVMKRAIDALGFGTIVTAHPKDVFDKGVLQDLSTCDVIFGCVDSIDGRHILNKLASAFLIPYIDLGVRLDADGKGGIDSIWLAIHTLQPGGSSLKSRGVYSQAELEAAFLQRSSPAEYEKQRKEGYIKGLVVNRPAVISVNMEAAAGAVNEFLARLHTYRNLANSRYAVRRVCLSDPDASYSEGDGEACPDMQRLVGTGDEKPFLRMPALEDD
ncbi:MAG: ThiF family adenylyltransferase [Burkholderiales bacterium]|nr:ThiF family adenylyltransferase [Burkholderiales bacterium]